MGIDFKKKNLETSFQRNIVLQGYGMIKWDLNILFSDVFPLRSWSIFMIFLYGVEVLMFSSSEWKYQGFKENFIEVSRFQG